MGLALEKLTIRGVYKMSLPETKLNNKRFITERDFYTQGQTFK